MDQGSGRPNGVREALNGVREVSNDVREVSNDVPEVCNETPEGPTWSDLHQIGNEKR